MSGAPAVNDRADKIVLRGVRVNNLKDVDLDIPHGQMVSMCGLSGSGKTSLAIDTLFAEGQRRYIECFSPYTRQLLDQLDKPDADFIGGIPPAILVKAVRRSSSARTTIGSVTEAIEYLRLLFARIATIRCQNCGAKVQRSSPQQILAELLDEPAGRKIMIGFQAAAESAEQFEASVSDMKRNGFRRGIINGRTYLADQITIEQVPKDSISKFWVVVDRLKTGELNSGRCVESLETAFFYGQSHVVVLIESDQGTSVDEQLFQVRSFSSKLICSSCQTEYPEPDSSLFSFNSANGACADCEGFGNVNFLDINKIVPKPSLTIREGAIAPWNTPAYAHELEELEEVAKFNDFPMDVPFADLSEAQVSFLWRGDRTRDFGGLDGFFAWLEKRKYKMHLRVFLSRWRSYRPCSVCHGKRLNPIALSFRINDHNLAEMVGLSIQELLDQLESLKNNPSSDRQTTELIRLVSERLQFLCDVGVGYLALDRQMRTLGSGERQRVALTRALGSSLVNLLYVLDEPSAGLHIDDMHRIIPQIKKLQDRNNTVVIVDHTPEMIKLGERLIEIGPEAGNSGGQIVFDGTLDGLVAKKESITGQFLAGERGFSFSSERRDNKRSRIQISGASGNNLKDITVDFPLDLLCVVSGVSGAGKSTLVRQTLAPALQNRLNDASNETLPFRKLHGGDRFDQVAVIDQGTLPRISRSNPATYVKAWDEIRKAFAETHDAKTRNLKPGSFSFNVEGGRCDHCNGEGYLRIDMQFMADVLRKCEQCQGARFKTEVCEVKYRNHNISDVLGLTANEAFSFFRGHRKVQARLKLLIDVGLGYVQIGQPVSTLSIGEAQRLKLASFLGQGSNKRTLFIMDEPTSGLHMADTIRLLDCFGALIDVGHSLIVIEHNLLMLAHADHIIDLGPGPANDGGKVVASGTPEEISENKASVTGRYLKHLLRETVH